VRLSAVHAFSELLSSEDSDSKLRNFYERFKPRIMEMAMSEIDEAVRESVIKSLIGQMNRYAENGI
jgi:hypothetical protein